LHDALPISRLNRFRGNRAQIVFRIAPWLRPFWSIQPLATVIADEILHDSIFERMKSDGRDPGSRFESRGQNLHALCERAQLIVDFHPYRLNCLRRGMPPSVASA